MDEEQRYILVTGATGFIGAHIVDELLRRGIRVRGATRSLKKGDAMIAARPQYARLLDFIQVDDLEKPNVFRDVIQEIDGIIHTASPCTFDHVTNLEKDIVLPAIHGVQSLLEAAATNPKIRRIVITSSFAAIIDPARTAPPYFVYTAADWTPLTYVEAVDPANKPLTAYRGSKKFAELAAHDFVRDRKPAFDLATVCPPIVFGPMVHPVASTAQLNTSSKVLWLASQGSSMLPPVAAPFWVDVRDLALAHVEALLRPESGGKRFLPCSPEPYSYKRIADIVQSEFNLSRDRVYPFESQEASFGADGETAAHELGITYRPLKQAVVDFVSQAVQLE